MRTNVAAADIGDRMPTLTRSGSRVVRCRGGCAASGNTCSTVVRCCRSTERWPNGCGARRRVSRGWWRQRAFTRRPVEVLAVAGMTQFLDLGCGLLSADCVYVSLLRYRLARSVHVDVGPFVAEYARRVIAGDGRAIAAVVAGDLRRPESVLAHPSATARLDLARPDAVVAVLAHLSAPDAVELLATVGNVAVAGTVLAISPSTADRDARVTALEPAIGAAPRSRAGLTSLLVGWEPVRPGLSWAHHWWPEANDPDGSPVLLAALAVRRGVHR